MCNEVARRIALDQIRLDFSQLKIPLVFPEGLPNLAPLDSIRITDPTAIVRAATNGDGAELVVRRWSWPGPSGKPVYNFRSDGRSLREGRCLIPVDAFYEFTAPEDGAKRKSKWAFSHAREPWFAIGGIWRADVLPEGQGGTREAFTMLTTDPGPDIAPYHSRQMVVIDRRDWARWLDGSVAAGKVCRTLAAGVLQVAKALTSMSC